MKRPVGRPTKYNEEMCDFESELDMQNFLMSDSGYEIIEYLIGEKIKERRSEVLLPLGTKTIYHSWGRMDLFIEGVSGSFYVFELKYKKALNSSTNGSEVLKTSHGLAQVLYYDTYLSEKHNIQVKKMFVVCNDYDTVVNSIIPRNNLNVIFVKLSRNGCETVSKYIKK